MVDACFESRFWVAASRPEVFRFLTDPENLARLVPASLHLRRLTPGPVTIGGGSVLDYRLRWRGIPIGLRMFVREYDPPVRLLVVQVLGPLARWEHRLIFLEADGGTRVEDRLVYKLPLGPIGRAAQRLFVAPDLERIWQHRNAALARHFGRSRVARA